MSPTPPGRTFEPGVAIGVGPFWRSFVTVYRTVHLPAGGPTMLGHEFAFTRTNQDHWIPLCSCGWIGAPSAWRRAINSRTKRESRNMDLTLDAVRREWDAHVDDEAEAIAKASERVLADNAAAVDKVIPIVMRPGRFGSG